jgi:hypothetical protein
VTDVSTMSNRELDRAIAEAMGEHVHDWEHDQKTTRMYVCRTCQVRSPAGQTSAPHSFSTDLNALRDGPERVLREAGWAQRVVQVNGARGCFWDAEWWTMQGDLHEASAPTEARARAEAALMALRVMKGEGNG